jgi:hypothetical protein
MRKVAIALTLAGPLFSLMPMDTAQAQATRTWVSGVGDDVNPCSRTAPCKTFAGAISKTAAGGEISVLDPGGYGAVTITKSMTINGTGTLASISSALTPNAVIVNGAGIKVVLRNISINGAGTGTNGVRFIQGSELTIDRCEIHGLVGNAVDMALSGSGNLFVKDTYISQVARGISVQTTAGFAVAAVSNTHIFKAGTAALQTQSNSTFIEANRMTLSLNNIAAHTAIGNGTIGVYDSLVSSNTVGFSAGAAGSTVRIAHNLILDNSTGFAIAGGATIASGGNNTSAGNFGATVPNATLTLQ